MIKKICQQCGKEFEAKRKTARFCSEACKQKNKRVVSVSNSVSLASVSDDLIDTEKEILAETRPKFKERVYSLEEVCTPDELKNFPAMCETKKEQAESLYRLDNNNIEELRKAGISIPNAYRNEKTDH